MFAFLQTWAKKQVTPEATGSHFTNHKAGQIEGNAETGRGGGGAQSQEHYRKIGLDSSLSKTWSPDYRSNSLLQKWINYF